MLDLIRSQCDLDLTLVGSFAGGEVGALDVRERDGARYVLKWWPGQDELAAGLAAADLVERLHRIGYPLPRYRLVDALGGVTVMLQEHLDGTVSDEVSDATVGELLRLNELQTGMAGDDEGRWASYLASSLVSGCHGYCVHESLRDYSPRTRVLLDEIQRIGCTLADEPPRGRDVVHSDFHHRNVLVHHRRVGAIIDWDGCRPGDCSFDLVTLAFGLTVAHVSDKARQRVWGTICGRTDPALRRAYVAHMALRQVDWSIRHRTQADVDHWLTVSEDFLARSAMEC